jgi:predicted transcriptional regulator
MTSDQLNAVLNRVRSWPEEDQEELIEAAHEIEARREDVYRLSEAERQGIRRGLTAMQEGRFASEECITAILKEARSSRK